MTELLLDIGEEIEVVARKYDGRPHRSWRARLARRDGSLMVLDAVFEEEVNHALLGRIARGTQSQEYYWTDRWYNVFRFAEENGALRNFYCNVSFPATLDGNRLDFIDLDIDVLVAPDFSYSVLDREEFETHAAHYHYPAEVKANALASLDELIALIEHRRFPFDES